jgi:cell division protein FtsQ
MPQELTDPDGDDSPRLSTGRRFDRSRNPWYRPASAVGRVFLSLVLLTVLGGFATSAFLLKTYLSRDGRFRIAGASNIEASGLTEVSRAQMLPVFGEDIGRNIFFVPLNERRKQLEEIPWIEKATVMRLLPDRISVSVVERQPVAFARHGAEFGLVDASGVLLSMSAAMMAQHNYSFPTLSGIDPHDSPAARQARVAVYLRLLGELDAGGQKLSSQISEVDLTDPEDALVTMQDDTTLLHFGTDRFLERYQRYKAHIAEWRQQYPKLGGVDLRYDQKVVLQMASGTDVAQFAASNQTASSAADAKPSDGQAAEIQQIAAKSAEKQPTGAKQSTTAAKIKPGKSSDKPRAKTSVKPKISAAQKKANALRAAAAKAKAARNARKHAEVKRAALTLNRQKTAPTAPPAANAGQGQ